jgi:signal transduction histidine kinase
MKKLILYLAVFFATAGLFAQKNYSKDTIPQRKRVLILHSVEEARPWNFMFNTSYREAIKNNCHFNVETSIEYLDLIRYNTEEYKSILEKTIRLKYQNFLPDVIVLTQIEAVNFVYERNLFPGIPKILVEIGNEDSIKYKNATIILRYLEFESKLEHALSLFPYTKEIYVVSGNSTIDSYTLGIFTAAAEKFSEQVSMKYLTGMSSVAILDSIKNLPENSLLYFLTFTKDFGGEAIMAKDFAEDIGKICNRPVFSFLDLVTEGTGIFGGMVVSLKSKAKMTVEVIDQVLNGKNIESIPPVKAGFSYTYDWNELKKWNINIDRLPKESIFYNREYTFWELYKMQVMGVIIVLLSYSVLLIMLWRNIRIKRKNEKQLIIAKEQAEESDRIKTAFLQNMSHEIRTPMNSIMGFASLLPDETDKDTLANFSNIIYRNAEQLVHVIDDIVLYSQLQNKQFTFIPKQFEAIKLIDDIKQSFNLPEYQQCVELKSEFLSNDSISIFSDYEKIRQVFTNLISNAFKYTEQGFVTFGLTIKDNQVLFFVKDTGVGIPDIECEHIFDRFYRASNVKYGTIGGTGLGLSIVKELLEILGGNIWVESEEGKGSTFYFSIPNQIKKI